MSDNHETRHDAAVASAAAASGVSAEHLTTLGRLYGLRTAPYDETVVLAPGTPDDTPDSPGWRWQGYLWRSYMAQERSKR